ncbi:MAG: hypothetical protein ACREEY_01760 [Brevundimonas sp.]
MTHLPSTHGYVPGGRWERILRLIRNQPLTRAEIFDALRTDETVLRVERRKVHFALSEMMRRGLIAWTPFGFVATAQGALELDGGDASFLSASNSETPFKANPNQTSMVFSSSVSTVDSPVSSRELPGSFGTATRSPKERHDLSASTIICCPGRTAQQEAAA